MSHTLKSEPGLPEPESVAAGYEVSDVKIRGIAILGIALAVAVAVAMVGLWALFNVLAARATMRDPEASPFAAERAIDHAPSPRRGPELQDNPGLELKEYLLEQEYKLTTYGWVDREQGIVRIPIALAMTQVADILPVRREQKPGTKAKPQPAGAEKATAEKSETGGEAASEAGGGSESRGVENHNEPSP